MDTKNDDSAGSDSLDKSLQKKCVVDDVGQGEGAATSESAETNERTSVANYEQINDNSTINYKTEKCVGDSGGNGNRSTDRAASCNSNLNLGSSPNAQDQFSTNQPHVAGTASVLGNLSASASGSTGNANNNAFETKVKQISKNLKETTLAETATKKHVLDDSASSSSSDYDQTNPSSSAYNNRSNIATDPESSAQAANESLDEHDHRSKKVRFHPDVKENDGGNRVIPKKKKKLRGAQGVDESGSGAQRSTGNDDEMDVDEEDETDLEEEEFDMAKTMSEAAAYLRSHPLTFVRPNDKTTQVHRKNGCLLEEEDTKEPLGVTSETPFIEQTPENGIKRILGKHISGGKTVFLVCDADRSKLYWEKDEFILKHCPNLLQSYEQNREKRQERLMLHVAKRQNVRQRYTDF